MGRPPPRHPSRRLEARERFPAWRRAIARLRRMAARPGKTSPLPTCQSPPQVIWLPMHSEAKIRDFLSTHLGIIEPGLTLARMEYRLENADGASGRIDILARDRHNHLVVIELKRSDVAARQALHELNKYVVLLRERLGLPYARIRCILVSTAWHELSAPFAEYRRRAPYSVDGRRLCVDERGVPTHCTSVNERTEGEERTVVPFHSIYLFEREAARDAAVSTLSECAQAVGLADFCILLLDSTAENPEHFPLTHSLYFAVDSLTEAQIELRAPDEQARVASQHQPSPDADSGSDSDRAMFGEPDWEDDPDENTLERRFRTERRLIAATANRHIGIHDSFEIGYPEKFAVMLATSWKVSKIIRIGRLHELDDAFTDEDILTELCGECGGNSRMFISSSSPRLEHSWQRLLDAPKYCLLGNDNWAEAYRRFLCWIAGIDASASVSVTIFNPLDIVVTIWDAMASGSSRYVPAMEVVARLSNAQEIKVLKGLVVWDPSVRPVDPEMLIKSVYPDGLRSYRLYRHFGDSWTRDGQMMAAHGLVYDAFVLELTEEGENKVFRLDDRGTLVPLDRELPLFHAFVDRNAEYCLKLAQLFGDEGPLGGRFQ